MRGEKEDTMGDAREAMDRVTAAVIGQDFAAAAACYAEDAVAVTPDQGEIRGREAIIEYLRQQAEVFPDSSYESVQKHESGNVAIDEGYFTGTHTAPLPLPSGDTVPPTGKQIRVRACDLATVEAGVITEHHFYFDQMEFLGQLGLLPEAPSLT
jgi:ketosteroid isomerase-like protein